ncbi:hypothetical protein CIB48_g5775 [Xylaria polymorpha]|nr:hypothetical protein CIB48_g5775 [Xylaria polymorpha]
MANASSCPEDVNSTDCLLRVLLQNIDNHFEEYSWDPITFGFTVIIGTIAALFAAFTIYQATISAGRGARKSNSKAVGEWSCKTTKKWDWHELCRISTAQTPILTISQIEKVLSKLESKPHESTPGNPTDNPAAASWLGFLDELGLNDLDLQEVPVKMIIADYLPDDLLAVPAYAQVGFIVAAAAAAGAYSWKTDKQSEYPTILGRSFQFEFRPHQTLGMIGAFAKYDYDTKNRRIPTTRQLSIAFQQARGDIEVGAYPLSFPPGEDRTHFQQCNVLDDSSYKIFDLLCRRIHDFSHECKSGICRPYQLLPLEVDNHDLMWLFTAKAPHQPPVIFPSQLDKISNALKFLAVHSNFWASLEVKRHVLAENTGTLCRYFPRLWNWYCCHDFPKPPSLLKLDDLFRFLEAQISNRIEGNKRNEGSIRNKDSNMNKRGPLGIPPSVFKDPESVCVFPIVLRPSIYFLYDVDNFKSWFSGLQQVNQQYFRILILLQIMQLDDWLAHREPQDVLCAILFLSITTLALLDADSALRDDPSRLSPTRDGPNPLENREIPPACPKDDISFDHFNTLQAVDRFLNRFRKFYEADESPISRKDLPNSETAKWDSLRYEKQTELFAFSDFSIHDPEDAPILFRALAGVLKRRYATLLSNTASTKEQKEPEEERTEEDHIRDVLIWRCILIAMLFSTAPNNGTLLRSDVWERVVPII